MSPNDPLTAKLQMSHRAYDDLLTAVVIKNYGVLAICVTLLITAVMVLYVIMKTAWTTWAQYRQITNLSGKADKQETKKTKKTKTNIDDKDDEVYSADILAADPPLSANDATRIKGAMTRLKGRYAGYNKALTDFEVKVKGRQPDDLIDEKILSQKHDNYVYETAAQLASDRRIQVRGDEASLRANQI